MPIRHAVNSSATGVDNRSGIVAVVLLVIHHQLHRRGEGHARLRGHDLEKLMGEERARSGTSLTLRVSGKWISVKNSFSSTVGNVA